MYISRELERRVRRRVSAKAFPRPRIDRCQISEKRWDAAKCLRDLESVVRGADQVHLEVQSVRSQQPVHLYRKEGHFLFGSRNQFREKRRAFVREWRRREPKRPPSARTTASDPSAAPRTAREKRCRKHALKRVFWSKDANPPKKKDKKNVGIRGTPGLLGRITQALPPRPHTRS